jgi:4-hydroxybenzoate polyprenyltransferase
MTILIQIISWLTIVYMLTALLLAMVTIMTSYEKLKKLKWWQQLLFFTLQPILIMRR